HDVLDVGRGYAQELGDVSDGIGSDVALLRLRKIQRGQDSRPTAIGRVARDDLVEARAVLRRIDKRRPFVFERAGRFVEGGAVGHLRVKSHRSTSPITTSMDPITAITSAIRPPTIIRSSAWHARSDGALDLRRQGRFVPSD